MIGGSIPFQSRNSDASTAIKYHIYNKFWIHWYLHMQTKSLSNMSVLIPIHTGFFQNCPPNLGIQCIQWPTPCGSKHTHFFIPPAIFLHPTVLTSHYSLSLYPSPYFPLVRFYYWDPTEASLRQKKKREHIRGFWIWWFDGFGGTEIGRFFRVYKLILYL